MSDGTWSFYDSFRAFPHSSVTERKDRQDVVADISMGLDAEGGGTHGEWTIRWYRFNQQSDEAFARLEAFGDSWAVLARSGLLDLLTEMDPKVLGRRVTPDEFMEHLRALGWTDRTDTLASHTSGICPNCYSDGFTGDREIAAWRTRVEQARKDELTTSETRATS